MNKPVVKCDKCGKIIPIHLKEKRHSDTLIETYKKARDLQKRIQQLTKQKKTAQAQKLQKILQKRMLELKQKVEENG